MEHKKISAVIFDMDGVIVDSEFVYMDYLLEFARKKNPEVTMDQLNPMVGLSRKDSWTVMKNAVDNGQTWEELRDEFAVLDIYSQVDYKRIFRPEAYTTAMELKKRGYKVALASSTGPKLIARIMEETGMRPVFDLIVSGGQFKQSKPNPEIYHYTAKTLGIPEEECFVVEDSTVGIQAGKAAGMTVAALEDDRFGFDQSQADIQIRQISEILKFLPGTENIVLCGASSYEQKYYFNQDFKALPEHIKKELQIMCVLFTEDIGGVLTMEFTPEGELDFESPLCLDMELLDRHFAALSRGEEILIPKYEFVRQMRNDSRGTPLRLGKNEIVVFEGIHALNDSIAGRHPEAAKLYISARSNINEGSVLRFKGTWMRLTRLAVRDYNFRGTGVEDTLDMWANVRRGEKLYISPFKNKADIIFDSSLPYEVSVMKHYALPLLEAVPEDNVRRGELLELIDAFQFFQPIDPELVDKGSLLREFIGGGSYHYV